MGRYHRATMAVFDCLVPLDARLNKTWSAATTRPVTHGSSAYANESARLLSDVQQDATVRAALAADLAIYHAAVVPAFRNQTRLRTGHC